MSSPPTSYEDISFEDIELLADRGHWPELLHLYRSPDLTAGSLRRFTGHVLVLEAPVEIAAAVVESQADDERGYSGPAWEVIGQRPWAEVSQHLRPQRIRHLVACTRAMFGEDLSQDTSLDPIAFGVPFVLQPWEFEHWEFDVSMSGYGRRSFAGGAFSALPMVSPVELPVADPTPVDHPAVPLLNEICGWAAAHAFRGTAWEAATVASARTTKTGAEVAFDVVYPELVQYGSGESAYGWNRGKAIGRLAAWRALAAMAGAANSVNALVERLRCVTWEEHDDEIWYLHVAMEDPAQGITWTLSGQTFD